MKRFLPLGLILAATSLGMVGCGETAKEEVTIKKDTPGGSSTVKETKEVQATGDQKPVAETPK